MTLFHREVHDHNCRCGMQHQQTPQAPPQQRYSHSEGEQHGYKPIHQPSQSLQFGELLYCAEKLNFAVQQAATNDNCQICLSYA